MEFVVKEVVISEEVCLDSGANTSIGCLTYSSVRAFWVNLLIGVMDGNVDADALLRWMVLRLVKIWE